MDFVNRAQQPRANVPNGTHQQDAGHPSPVQSNSRKGQNRERTGKLLRIANITLLFSITVLLIAMAIFIGFKNNGEAEAKFVNKNEYQAVFINVDGTTGGQVYFGHIQSVTSQYIDLTNVFYIQDSGSSTSTSSANQSYTLVKLGCELHAPEDEMIINTSQVFFWENLRPSGQVSTKIAQYYKENPNGLNCSASSSASQNATNTQNSATTPSSTDTTKK